MCLQCFFVAMWSIAGCFAFFCGDYCAFWIKRIPKNNSCRGPSCAKPPARVASDVQILANSLLYLKTCSHMAMVLGSKCCWICHVKNYPGKRPQTVWGSGRIMYDNVADGDDDGDDDEEEEDEDEQNVADDDVEDEEVKEDDVEDDEVEDDDVEEPEDDHDNSEDEVGDDKVEDDDVEKEDDEYVEEDDDKVENVAGDEVGDDDVAEDEVEVDDVEDDEVKGRKVMMLRMLMLRGNKVMMSRSMMLRTRTDPKTGTHTLCEPAQSKYARGNLQEKCPSPEPRRRLYASLRSRNAGGHFTRATLCGNLQEKCLSPEP